MKRYIIFLAILTVILVFVGAPIRFIYSPLKYRPAVKYYSGKHGLDWLLITSIIFHESSFRSNAVSASGARGLMQIMPDTARDISKKIGINSFSVDMLFNPEINLNMGCFYFKRLLRYFEGDERLALSAYNAGIGSIYKWWENVKGKYKNGSKISYACIYRHIYPETKIYVHKINGTYRLLKSINKIIKL